MGPISFLCACVFVVFLYQIQGFSAVTPVFVQKGKDVLLSAMKDEVLQGFVIVVWRFNQTTIIVTFSPNNKPTVSPDYTGRVEFSVKDFSLNLKNLQEADSGVYTAQVIRNKEETTSYMVTVQHPVSPAVLTVDSVSSSSDSCNLTVTCRSPDSHINSTVTCDNHTCSQEGGERSEVTASGASLHLHLVNGSVTCNHSNQVSWMEDIKVIEPLCARREGLTASSSINPFVWIVVPLICVVGILVILFLRKRRKCKTISTENTVYEVPQVETRAQPVSPPDYASSVSPLSTYCLVGPHTGPVGSRQTSKKQPESIYAQINKPDRS